MQKPKTTLQIRVISSLVMLAFFSAIIIFNDTVPILLNIVIGLISMICVYELLKVAGLDKNYTFLVPSLIVSFIAPFIEALSVEIYLFYVLYSVFIFIMLIMQHKKISFRDVSTIYSMTLLIPLSLLTIVSSRGLHEKHGMFYAILTVVAAWAPDVGAYFAGTYLGKHKLCPEISPKKTVEGVIGGSIFSTLFLLGCGLVFSEIYYAGAVDVNYWAIIILAVCGSLTSVLGDLSFSLIKRNCGVKDFGQVIPGHGGLLDRFDSVIFTAPCVYYLMLKLPIVIV